MSLQKKFSKVAKVFESAFEERGSRYFTMEGSVFEKNRPFARAEFKIISGVVFSALLLRTVFNDTSGLDDMMAGVTGAAIGYGMDRFFWKAIPDSTIKRVYGRMPIVDTEPQESSQVTSPKDMAATLLLGSVYNRISLSPLKHALFIVSSLSAIDMIIDKTPNPMDFLDVAHAAAWVGAFGCSVARLHCDKVRTQRVLDGRYVIVDSATQERKPSWQSAPQEDTGGMEPAAAFAPNVA